MVFCFVCKHKAKITFLRQRSVVVWNAECVIVIVLCMFNWEGQSTTSSLFYEKWFKICQNCACCELRWIECAATIWRLYITFLLTSQSKNLQKHKNRVIHKLMYVILETSSLSLFAQLQMKVSINYLYTHSFCHSKKSCWLLLQFGNANRHHPH